MGGVGFSCHGEPMPRQKAKTTEKRKRIILAMRPDVHDRLRKLAQAQNLSMSRTVENLILKAVK